MHCRCTSTIVDVLLLLCLVLTLRARLSALVPADLVPYRQ